MRVFIILSLFISSVFSSQANINFLTNNEKEWLRDNKTIKMCANPIWAPIGFFNKETNQPEGISIDTMKLIEKKLGNNIKFKYIHTSSWKDSQRFLKEGKCDFISLFRKNEKREKYALFTKPYMSYKFAIITRNDKPFVNKFADITNKSIARKKGSGMIYKIKKQFPNANIIETKDFLDSLQKVSKGEAYAAVATLPVLSYNANRFGIYNVQIAGYTDMETKLSIGVSKEQPILYSILEKGLAQITKQEHKSIQDKWMSIQIKEVKSNNIVYIILSLLLFVLVIYYVYKNHQSKKTLKELNRTLEKKVEDQTKNLIHLNEELKNKNKELNIINDKMKDRVAEQIDELRTKDKQLLEQSKLMAMGEMIGNIAHQWRQPLSIITTTSAIDIKKALGELDDEYINKSIKTINRNVQYLSSTIDTFKNFIKDEKVLKYKAIEDEISQGVEIISSSLKNSFIKIIDNINYEDKTSIYMSNDELSQVIMNILNNAKDILVEKKVDDPWVKLDLEKENNKIIITIEDNGGGIPEDVLPHIFEPYFTTKHQSQGTGLGLHMSYRIVIESLKGKIWAKNTNNGAKFFIEIHLDKEKQ